MTQEREHWGPCQCIHCQRDRALIQLQDMVENLPQPERETA